MIQQVRFISAVLCSVGLILSGYSYYVEVKKSHDEKYRAMCDISESISCSAVFTSKFGTGFGIMEYIVGEKSILNQPNSVTGVIFYIVQLMLGEFDSLKIVKLQIILAIISNLGSVYLSYILYVVLEDLCVVCVSIYVVNALLLACYIFRHRCLKSIIQKKKRT